jgi:hypothetical protein
MLKTMDELDEIWRRMIDEASARARLGGRSDVADYLALRANNDQLRSAGCKWLFDSFLELSDEASRQGIRLEIEQENPHRFDVGAATMVGSLLRFRFGIRSLTIEAGWTRTPADGFMRGNSLARARITHFGIRKANAELALLRPQTDAPPEWFAIGDTGGRSIVAADDLRRHFGIFTGSGV